MQAEQLGRFVIAVAALVALSGSAVAGESLDEPSVEAAELAGPTSAERTLVSVALEAPGAEVTLSRSPATEGEPGPELVEVVSTTPTPEAREDTASAELDAEVPLSVLLTREPSRGSFKLVEMGVHDLRRGADAIRDARDRYELDHVDYEQILERIEALARDVERTFRPDLEPDAPFYPDAGPVLVDEGLWRIGAPTP